MSISLSVNKKEEADGWEYSHYVADIENLGAGELVELASMMTSDFIPMLARDFGAKAIDFGSLTFSVRIGSTTVISEKVLWELFIDNLDDCEMLIKRYIDAIYLLFDGKINLPWTSTKDQLGAICIQSYFDKAIEHEQFSAIDISVYDAYLTHLKMCDLDHEVNQHDYIIKIIRVLVYRDTDRLSDWVWFCYNNGQNGGADSDIHLPSLMVNGVLKSIVDRMLLEGAPRESVLELCALAYGGDIERICQVVDYASEKQKKAGIPFAGRSNSRTIPSSNIVANDRFINSVTEKWPVFEISTGFHRLDRKRKRWVPIDDSEVSGSA